MKESVRPKNRFQVMLENMKGVHQWRSRDVTNFLTMLMRMPKSTRKGPNIHPAQVALEMFTRMELNYEPCESEVREPTPRGTDTLKHTFEPTVALFVDAPEHMSGVSTTLREWAVQARHKGRPFFLHMSGSDTTIPGCKAFPHCGTLRISSYEGLDVPIPDVKTIVDYMEAHPFDVAHLSTPGPMGLLGMHLAQRKGLSICGTYHTDFPRYTYELTGSREFESFTWEYMRWFYGQMDLVAAPSPATRDDLISHGFDPNRIRVVGRGVHTDAFSPEHASAELRDQWGGRDKKFILNVGRVSREKNLELLAHSYRQIAARDPDTVLVVVGDGPYREDMMELLKDTPAVFTGVLRGHDLAQAYASADLFVFPSETDTFGVVLIEAQASGLPVIVSDRGGPRGCVRDGETGQVVSSMTETRLAHAVEEELADKGRLKKRGLAARQHALTFTPERSFHSFWDLHREVQSIART